MSDSSNNQPSFLRRLLLHLVLPAVVLSLAGWQAWQFMQTSPRAKRKPPVQSAPLVEVVQLQRATNAVTIEAMGVVRPARQINLRPRVNGQVESVSPEYIPGGYFRAGDTLLSLDATDFELAVREAEANVDMARSTLALEQGQQAVARKEFELLGESIDEKEHALVLRKPQLATAQAELDRAVAALKQARLDLQRTVIKLPFNARLRSRNVNVGVQVTTATDLAAISGTDVYWIELTVPVSQLKWIDIPRHSGDEGSSVRVYDSNAWGTGVYRTGRVIRLAADLETEGRLARLLVAVDDPLSLQPENAGLPQLILGSFLRVDIEGRALSESFSIDRKLLRNGDTVWILNPQNRLEIRRLSIAFNGRDHVLIEQGIADGERLITTPLAAPVPGMPLRAENAEAVISQQP